ncbi:MAG: GDP-L-fucose synthase [Spirochaetaceae bacterium]|nr:MAG: GDP-L-fucose synthase [Spirochaetaceae bacterium]
MNKQTKIYVAGHRGMVGSAVVRRLQAAGHANLITRTHAELDLTRQQEVEEFFARERPEVVVLAAARVGGILANNTYRAEFIYQNTMIAANVIHAAWQHGVQKLLNLGSSCIYPKHAPQPMKEEHLLTGPLEPTNEPYAVAKIAAIKLCRSYHEQYGANFFSAMPSNLYGPGDNFDLQTSHVLAALLRKVHDAQASGEPHVTVWGDGTPLREFLYVDDLADAVLFLLQHVNAADLARQGLPDLFLNVGSGREVTIADLARLICNAAGYPGERLFDTSKPNGTPRKLMDCSRMAALGWRAETELDTGIRTTYQWYQSRQDAP